MEIRGKHNCVLASVSTKLPPLEGRVPSVNHGGKSLELSVKEIVRRAAERWRGFEKARRFSAGLGGYAVKDVQEICR